MNLHNKILMALFALGTILWSCDSLIYDDLADCPQGVYVKFYSMTPCAQDSTFIGSVSSLTVFAFDESGKLVASTTQQNVILDRKFEVLMPVSNGNFTFFAWAGINDKFDTGSFTNGKTTKDDVMVTLKSTAGMAADLSGTKVWQGESPVVFLPNPEETGSFYEHTAVNLGELTNRISVTVEFHESVKGILPKELAIAVSSANGTVNIDDSMPANNPSVSYPYTTEYANNSVTWKFNLMDLVTGYKNVLKIDYPEKKQILFNGDLIGSILLNTIDANINLGCDNDFDVRFVLKDYCEDCGTWFSCDVFVNNWPVHSYEIAPGI